MPTPRPTHLPRDNHRPGWATFLRPSAACLIQVRVVDSAGPGPKSSTDLAYLALLASAGALFRRYGNINPLSIDYACRPRLRSRLTQGGLTWPWNPWSFGGRGSHPSFATHACILTRARSTPGSPRSFSPRTTLPYPPHPLNHKG